MAETIYLEPNELTFADGPMAEKTILQIVLSVENLRSRSIASRYMSITGRFRAEVEKIGGTIESIGAHRAISFRLLDGRRLRAYPVVGVPSAELLNDIAEKAAQSSNSEKPILVYDHIGIRGKWASHLKWLDENIHVVRSIKVFEASWALANWETET